LPPPLVITTRLRKDARIHVPDREHVAMQPALEELWDEYQRQSEPLRRRLLRSYLESYLVRLERCKRAEADAERLRQQPTLLTGFQQKLEHEFACSREVSHYARALGVTPKTLNQTTQRALGLSAKQFICERVVLEARRLLAHSSLSVKEIAFELGFEESTNFVKFFRREVAVAPEAFRQRSSR